MIQIRREIRLPIYWLLVGLAVMLGSPLLSVLVSVQVNQRTLAAAERARAETMADATLRYCRLVGAQVDVYSEAESKVGRAAYQTWLTEYRIQGCEPGK